MERVGLHPHQRQPALTGQDLDTEAQRLFKQGGERRQAGGSEIRVMRRAHRWGERGHCLALAEDTHPSAERRLRRREFERDAKAVRLSHHQRQAAQRHPESLGSAMVRKRKASASSSSSLPALSSPKGVIWRTASIAARLPITPVSAPSTP